MWKKILYVFSVFMIFTFPSFVNAATCLNEKGEEVYCSDGSSAGDESEKNLNIYESTDCNTTGSCFDGLGLQVTIFKYSGPGSEPKVVGKPILIYHKDLFKDVTFHSSVPLPNSYGDFSSKNWGFGRDNTEVNGHYVYGPNGPQWVVDTSNNSAVISTAGDDVSDLVHEQNNPNVSGSKINFIFENGSANSIRPTTSATKPSPLKGSSGYYHYIFNYSSNDKIITYRGNDIDNLGDYYAIYNDNNITANNIAQDYLSNTIVKTYFKDVQSVKKYFGIDINYSEIDKYYVSVESVQRIYGGIKKITGSYLAKKVETITRETKNYEWNEKSKKINCVNKTQTYTTYNDCTNKCSGSCTTTGYQEITCSYQKCDTTSYWEVENNIPGRKNIHKIYGKYADGYSYIKTSRSLQATNQTSSSYLNLLFDACTVNKHCELENDNKTCRKDKNGNVIYQYYIGPNLDKAFLGTTKNNYYQLIGGCSKNPSGTSAVGVKHYYLADLVSCKNTCGTYITDFRSDDYLKCAENYCDAQVDFNLKGNARTRKKDCIISCGYSYGIGTDDNGNPSYTASNRESVNSCKNSSPYNGIKKVEVSANSQCSINSATGDNIYNTKGIITNCVGDQITDFDNDDTNDTIFDHRKYINVACKETSGFNFLDLTGKRYLAGQGIDYYTKLNGEKECTVYFNLEQWKFDYATISSKDPDRRKRLLYIYSVYNNALNDSYDKTKNPYYDPDFLSENDGEITWSEYEYDINKVNVISKVREIVNNLVKQSMNYNLVVNSKDESVNATVISKEEIKQIYNLNLNKQQVNRYLQTSKVNANYVFDKYCVTNDGKATVYKPNNGVCYVANGVDVLGKNVYYTDLNATPDKNFSETIKNQGQGHLVSTDVSVGEDRKEENEYYKDGESCPYKIDDESLGCSIVVKNNDGTEMHGNDIYVNGGVTANLKVNERLGIEDEVENVGITNGNTPVANGNKTISVNISDKRNGIETIEIVGIVESKKGKSAICRKKINIIDPSDSCGVSCSVNKDNNNYKLYEIKSTGKQKPNSYWTALSTNMRWVTVKPNISDGRYLVRLNNEIGNTLDGKGNIIYDETIVYGKVDGTMVTTGEKCSNVCWSETPKLPNCPKDYDPANTGAIKNYCERYWDKDVNNYVSVDDCISSCSNDRMCPEDKRDLKEVEKECSINYKEWGFSKTSNCVNYCYYCPDCSNDYIYRPVNNYNPFPFSSDSNTLGFNYQTGNRKVPSNWIGKTGYIKADDQDESSVTGANANQKVEYEIELTPSMIRDIRKDTESYNSGEGNDAYLDYVYMKGVDTTKRYYSKFINETFRSYFTTIDGTEV